VQVLVANMTQMTMKDAADTDMELWNDDEIPAVNSLVWNSWIYPI
jgi:hypothetical protein